jgi:hypothetical protein
MVITSSQSWVDLTSNIGGMLGVCAGISLVSLAEIIYWLLLFIVAKIPSNIPRNKTTKKKSVEKKPNKVRMTSQPLHT